MQTYKVHFTPYYSVVLDAASDADAVKEAQRGRDLRPIRVELLSDNTADARSSTGLYGLDFNLCLDPERCRAEGRCMASRACSE